MDRPHFGREEIRRLLGVERRHQHVPAEFGSAFGEAPGHLQPHRHPAGVVVGARVHLPAQQAEVVVVGADQDVPALTGYRDAAQDVGAADRGDRLEEAVFACRFQPGLFEPSGDQPPGLPAARRAGGAALALVRRQGGDMAPQAVDDVLHDPGLQCSSR